MASSRRIATSPPGDVDALWHRLSTINTIRFEAHSELDTGWNGVGEGTVQVTPSASCCLLFEESGTWTPQEQRPLSFRNVFRWTLYRDAPSIRLEHLRFGPDQPVHLFDLVPVDAHSWHPVSPHSCGDDVYAAQLTMRDDHVKVMWNIAGPRKRVRMVYWYE